MTKYFIPESNPVDKIIEYMPTGHKYTVYKDLSVDEKKLVRDRMQALYDINNKLDKLAAEKRKLRMSKQTTESSIRMNEITIKELELNDQSNKVRAELNDMMTSTLRNCFKLTISQIYKLDSDERRTIFLRLANYKLKGK